MEVAEFVIATEARLAQYEKAPKPMERTDFGISTVAMLAHPLKVDLPMEVTEFGISTEARLVQLEKADCPMEVTEVGISTEARLVQYEKANLLMEVTEVPIFTDTRLVQSSKADCPMEVTEVGIFTDTRLVQLKKADCPMEGTPLGIATSPCVSGSIKQSASHPDTAKARQYKNTANAIDGHVGNAPRYIGRRCQAHAAVAVAGLAAVAGGVPRLVPAREVGDSAPRDRTVAPAMIASSLRVHVRTERPSPGWPSAAGMIR